MNSLKKHIVLIGLILTCFVGFSQQQNLPLNREFNLVNQKVFNGFNNNSHTSFLPINNSLIDTLISEDSNYLININKEEKRDRSWLMRKMFYENLLIVDTGNFYLTVDPLFNIEMGKDIEDESGKTLYKNTRGVIVRANVGEKFSFETSLYENQMVLPGYLTDYTNSTGVIPGQGRWKAFKTNQGYDFASASANVSYSPAKFINFQLGTGKNFIGDGYRSLLLSDASFNYPFWKITTTFGKKDQFQYTKLNASLSSVTRREESSSNEALFVRKTMSVHYLSWLATKWLNIGLFESTLWHTEDTSGTKPLQFQQFNPIIGINTITTITDDANHSNIGLNLKIKLPIDLILYSQFVYDGNQYEKTTGYQIGMRYAGIKNLTFQSEMNVMSNPNNSVYEPQLEQFTNYNESLTHPLGNNFNEILGIINYKYKRIFIELKGIMATSTNSSDQKLYTIQSHLGFLVNPKNNMSLIAGVKIRKHEFLMTEERTNYVYFGFRTNLRNLYDDF